MRQIYSYFCLDYFESIFEYDLIWIWKNAKHEGCRLFNNFSSTIEFVQLDNQNILHSFFI